MSDLLCQFVANATYCDEIMRLAGVFFQLLAQVSDMYAKAVFIAIIIGAPDSGAKRVVSYNMAAVFCQFTQQRKLRGGLRSAASVR